MPYKKTLSFLIKIGIVFFSFYFIYNELVSNNNLDNIEYKDLLDVIKGKYLIFSESLENSCESYDNSVNDFLD